MERNKSKYILAIVFVLAIYSCKSVSYIDMLTGGSVRYWQNTKYKDNFISFDKEDMKTADYEGNYLLPLNVYDAVNGTDFKVEGNSIVRYWKKIPAVVDTIKIVKLTNRKMVLLRHNGIRSVTYKRHRGPQDPTKMYPMFGGEQPNKR